MKAARHVVEVIRQLVQSEQDISVSDISRHLGLNRSTASRLLAALRDGGLVEQNPMTQKYRPGMLALQLGMRSRSSFDVLDWVTSQSEQVVREIGHTVCIGVLEGKNLLIVATKRRETPIFLALDVGTSIPAHASSMGKVILATMPNEEVRARLPIELPELTGATRKSIDDLLADLEFIRSNGYSITHDELANGISSHAVSLQVRDNLVIAIGVAFLSNEQHSDEYKIISSLLEFKQRVSEELRLAKGNDGCAARGTASQTELQQQEEPSRKEISDQPARSS